MNEATSSSLTVQEMQDDLQQSTGTMAMLAQAEKHMDTADLAIATCLLLFFKAPAATNFAELLWLIVALQQC